LDGRREATHPSAVRRFTLHSLQEFQLAVVKKNTTGLVDPSSTREPLKTIIYSNMRLIQQQRWIEGSLLLCLCQTALAFQPGNQIQRKQHHQGLRLQAFIDPTEIVSAASSHVSHPEIPALLSTLMSSALQPAHGHSNPLFGPPDHYLEAGKSIVPSAKALLNMGVDSQTSNTLPEASPAFQESVTAAVNKGWKLLNGANIRSGAEGHLPGFEDTQGILSARGVPADSPESFASEVKWAAGYFNVMDKLPFVAFWYAMVEFFILRPGVDMYKEDIEDDPVGVTVDTVSVTAIRMAAIALISTVTLGFFG
jgi:hypothetical protein